MTKNETRLLLFAVILISACGLANNSLRLASAQGAFDFGISLNGYSMTVAPNHSGYVQVAVSLVSGTAQNVTLSSAVSPQDGQLSASFAPQSYGDPPFVTTLVVSALGAAPSRQYEVTVTGAAGGLVKDAPVLTVTIGCVQGTCATLTTTTVGNGMVDPLCSSGCSEPIGGAINVSAVPAPGWAFAGWNVTGAACISGLASSPCDFSMPNGPVSVTGNFVPYQQTLYTTYTGLGQLTPYCPNGCPEPIGAHISITATPAQGWMLSGYQLTNGVSCGSEAGYACSFTMPDFPVSFQVTFTPMIAKTTLTAVSSWTITTSFTRSIVLESTSTSTVTSSTVSIVAMGETTSSTLISTTGLSVTQTETSLSTQFLTSTANAISVTTSLENPPLELALALIILISTVLIGVNLIRRSRRGRAIVCGHCSFNNPSARVYCANCGEKLGAA